MLPLNMLPKVVSSQRTGNPILPPVNDRIAAARSLIQQRAAQLERIKTEVLEQLAESANEVKDTLDSCVNLLAADDPNRAVRPQLDNLTKSLADIEKIKDQTLSALQSDNHKLAERSKQCDTLKNQLGDLQFKLAHPVDSQGMAFAKEFGTNVAVYAANKGK